MPNATHQKPNYGFTNTPYFSASKWWEYLQIVAYSFTETLGTPPGVTSFLSLRKVIISNSQFLCDLSSLVLEFWNFLKSAKPIHIPWRSQDQGSCQPAQGLYCLQTWGTDFSFISSFPNSECSPFAQFNPPVYKLPLQKVPLSLSLSLLLQRSTTSQKDHKLTAITTPT